LLRKGVEKMRARKRLSLTILLLFVVTVLCVYSTGEANVLTYSARWGDSKYILDFEPDSVTAGLYHANFTIRSGVEPVGYYAAWFGFKFDGLAPVNVTMDPTTGWNEWDSGNSPSIWKAWGSSGAPIYLSRPAGYHGFFLAGLEKDSLTVPDISKGVPLAASSPVTFNFDFQLLGGQLNEWKMPFAVGYYTVGYYDGGWYASGVREDGTLVPEPATLMILGFGLVGVGFLRRIL